jgi:SPP1 gp7 family putative phage head morphogenesis protein
MCSVHGDRLITHQEQSRTDPSRTLTLRRRFEREVGRRFRILRGRIREEIDDLDGFGLRTNRGRFDFPRDRDKVGQFMRWLGRTQRQEILGVAEGVPMERAAEQAWTRTYIDTAYQRGIAQSAAEMRGGGVTVDQRWVDTAFNRPVHADRAGLIYTRTYSELVGVTDAMDQQISRVLAQSIAEGRNPRHIASILNDRVNKIGLPRARMIARTEVIRAHAESTLNAYEEAGIVGVEIEAEWVLGPHEHDMAPCPECEAAALGGPYTIEESRGMIPLHPNCRCVFKPRVVDGTGIELR